MVRQAINHHRIKRNEKFHLGFKPSRTNLLIYEGKLIDVERNTKTIFHFYENNSRQFHDVESTFVSYNDKSISGTTVTVLEFDGRCYGLNFYYRHDIGDTDVEAVVQSLSKVCRTFADDYMKKF